MQAHILEFLAVGLICKPRMLVRVVIFNLTRNSLPSPLPPLFYLRPYDAKICYCDAGTGTASAGVPGIVPENVLGVVLVIERNIGTTAGARALGVDVAETERRKTPMTTGVFFCFFLCFF